MSVYSKKYSNAARPSGARATSVYSTRYASGAPTKANSNNVTVGRNMSQVRQPDDEVPVLTEGNKIAIVKEQTRQVKGYANDLLSYAQQETARKISKGKAVPSLAELNKVEPGYIPPKRRKALAETGDTLAIGAELGVIEANTGTAQLGKRIYNDRLALSQYVKMPDVFKNPFTPKVVESVDAVNKALDSFISGNETRSTELRQKLELKTPFQNLMGQGFAETVKMVPIVMAAYMSKGASEGAVGSISGMAGSSAKTSIEQQFAMKQGVGLTRADIYAAGSKGAFGLTNSTLFNAGKDLGTMMPFGITALGGYLRDADKKGATPVQQWTSALPSAALEVVSEMIPLGFLKKVLGVSDDLVIAAAKSGANKAAAYLGEFAKAEVYNMATQIVQEVGINPITNAIEKFVYNPKMPWTGEGAVLSLSEAVETAKVTGVMTLMLSALGLPVSFRSHQMALAMLKDPATVDALRSGEFIDAIKTDLADEQSVVDNAPTPPQTDNAQKPSISSYNLRTASGEFVPIKASPVTIGGYEQLPTAIYRTKQGQFVVVEARTGVRIAEGINPDIAKMKAYDALEGKRIAGTDPMQMYEDISQAAPAPGYVSVQNMEVQNGQNKTQQQETAQGTPPVAQGNVLYADPSGRQGVGLGENFAQGETIDASFPPSVHAALANITRSMSAQGLAQNPVNLVQPIGKYERNISKMFQKAFGIKVAFFDGDTMVNGAVDPSNPDVVFINRKTTLPMHWVAGHEFGHTLQVNHPDLYEKVLDILDGLATDEQIKKYSDKALHNSSTIKEDRRAILEEMANDELGNMFTDKKFWDRVALQGREFFRKVAQIALDIIGKMEKAEVDSYLDSRTIKTLRSELERVVKEVMDGQRWTEEFLNDSADQYAKERAQRETEQASTTEAASETQMPEVKFSIRMAAIEEAFKDSKVRDEDGSLKPMYHGTNKKRLNSFVSFIPNFFTEDPAYAKLYGKKNMLVYLNIVNPFDAGNDPVSNRVYNEEFVPYAKGRFPVESKRFFLLKPGQGVPFTTADYLFSYLLKMNRTGTLNYDGIYVDEGDTASLANSTTNIAVVPLRNTQIKSPYSDNPVDLKNPDIRYSTLPTDTNAHKFPESLANNPNTPDEVKARLFEMEKTYDVAHNKASVARAAQIIAEDYQTAYDRAMTSKESGPVIGAMRFYFMADAYSRGDWFSAIQWAEVLNTKGKEAGQAVQIYNMLRKITPEGAIVFGGRMLDRAVSDGHRKRIEKERDQAKTAMDDINKGAVDGVADAAQNKLDEMQGNEVLPEEMESQKADRDAKASRQAQKDAEAHLKKALERAEQAKGKADEAKAKSDAGIAKAEADRAESKAKEMEARAKLKKATAKAERKPQKAEAIKEMTAEQMLAERVKRGMKTRNPSAPDPVAAMVKTLYELASKLLPDRTAKVANDPFKVMADAINNKDEFRRVWEASKGIVEQMFHEDPKALAELDAWFAEYLKRPFTNKQLNKVVQLGLQDIGVTGTETSIAPKVKASGISLKELVVQHYSVVDAMNRTLLEKIQNETGLTGAEAAYLNWFITEEMNARTSAKKEAVLAQLFKPKKLSAAKDRKTFVQKMIEMSNLGALHSSKYAPLLAERLGIPTMTPELAQRLSDLAEQIQMITGTSYEDNRTRAVLSAQMTAEIENRISETPLNKFLEGVNLVQTFSMLSGPKSIIRNINGNSLFFGIDLNKDILASGIDKVFSLASGKRTVPLPHLRGMPASIKRSFKEGMEDRKLGIDTSMGASPYEIRRRKATKGLLKWLNDYLYIGLRLPDRIMTQISYDSHMTGLQLMNNTTDMTDEMVLESAAFATRKTFNNKSGMAKALSGIKKTLNAGKPWGFGDLLLKFPNVPGNLLTIGLEYTPISFVRAIYHMAMVGVEAHQEGVSYADALPARQAKISNAIAEGVLGTGILMFGYLLRSMGFITVGGDDDKDKNAMMRKIGLGNYKLNMSAMYRYLVSGFDTSAIPLQKDDLLWSYDWMLPLSVPVTIGANIYDAKKPEGSIVSKSLTAFNSLVSGFAAGMQTVADQPLFSGITTFMRNRDITDAILQTFQGMPASFVPAALKLVRDLYDNGSRSTYAPDRATSAMYMIMNKVPGLNTKLPVYFDILGEPLKVFPAGNNFFDVVFNPALVSRYKPTPEALFALNTIFEAENESIIANANTLYPKAAPYSFTMKVNGANRKYELSGPELSRFQQMLGNTTRINFANLAKKVDTMTFKGATAEEQATNKLKYKVDEMLKILTFATKTAKETIVDERPDLPEPIGTKKSNNAMFIQP